MKRNQNARKEGSIFCRQIFKKKNGLEFITGNSQHHCGIQRVVVDKHLLVVDKHLLVADRHLLEELEVYELDVLGAQSSL